MEFLMQQGQLRFAQVICYQKLATGDDKPKNAKKLFSTNEQEQRTNKNICKIMLQTKSCIH